MASKKKDVLNRLDSLLQQEEEDVYKRGAGDSNGFSGTTVAAGVGRKKARSIRFADDDELHEIIGYSERYSDGDDSDEAEDEPDFRRRRNCDRDDDGDGVPLTVEERNVINITKKNTNFNAHAQNLLGGALRLGDKRHVSADDGPLLVTVRPFSSRATEPSFGKANKPVNSVKVGVRSGEMCEVGNGADVNEEHVSRANFAAARLSFLNSTLAQETVVESIQKHRNKCVSEVEVEMEMGEEGEEEAIVKSETDSEKLNDCESKGEDRRSMSEVSPEAAEREEEDAAGAFKGEDDEEVAKEDGELFENANASDGCGQNTKAAVNKPSVVKLMRRTSSNSPGSTILKGTPKPVVVVKSKQAAPAPPLPAKEKPKIPAKPKILLPPQRAKNATATTPVAAPRRGPSFSQKGQAPVANLASSALRDSPSEYASLAAECYSTQADAQNEVIFEVNATRVKEKVEEEENVEEEHEMEEERGDEMEDAVTVNRQEKNRSALDEIKKSLEASRYDDGSDGQSNSMSSYTSSSLSASSATTTASSSSSSSSASSRDETQCCVDNRATGT